MKVNLERYYKWLWLLFFVIMLFLCCTLFHDVYLNWGFLRHAITYLDGKADTVLGLTAASSSASVAVTLIPGDVGTPIANKLADISSYSVIILAAVHLEKYLITLSAILGFRFLLPAACVGAGIYTAFWRSEALKSIVLKLCVFAVAVILVVPASVFISNKIEETYQNDKQFSYEETQREADEIREKLENSDQSLWEQFVSSITGGTTAVVKKFETSLNNFIEAIAVMLITSCVIPLLTFMVLIWFTKSLLNINAPAPSLPELANKTRINPNQITATIKRGDENE